MRALLAVVLVLLAACSGGTEPETTGNIVFTLDGQTCTGGGSVSIEMFVDGTSQGVANFSSGTQRRVEVEAGVHTAGARVSNSNLIFTPANVNVPVGGEVSYIMYCVWA